MKQGYASAPHLQHKWWVGDTYTVHHRIKLKPSNPQVVFTKHPWINLCIDWFCILNLHIEDEVLQKLHPVFGKDGDGDRVPKVDEG